MTSAQDFIEIFEAIGGRIAAYPNDEHGRPCRRIAFWFPETLPAEFHHELFYALMERQACAQTIHTKQKANANELFAAWCETRSRGSFGGDFKAFERWANQEVQRLLQED